MVEIIDSISLSITLPCPIIYNCFAHVVELWKMLINIFAQPSSYKQIAKCCYYRFIYVGKIAEVLENAHNKSADLECATTYT